MWIFLETSHFVLLGKNMNTIFCKKMKIHSMEPKIITFYNVYNSLLNKHLLWYLRRKKTWWIPKLEVYALWYKVWLIVVFWNTNKHLQPNLVENIYLWQPLKIFFFNYTIPRRIFDDWWPHPARFPNIRQEKLSNHRWELIANMTPSHLFSNGLWPRPTRLP